MPNKKNAGELDQEMVERFAEYIRQGKWKHPDPETQRQIEEAALVKMKWEAMKEAQQNTEHNT